MSSKYFEACFKFSSDRMILLDGELAGTCVRVNINGIDTNIIFPSFEHDTWQNDENITEYVDIISLKTVSISDGIKYAFESFVDVNVLETLTEVKKAKTNHKVLIFSMNGLMIRSTKELSAPEISKLEDGLRGWTEELLNTIETVMLANLRPAIVKEEGSMFGMYGVSKNGIFESMNYGNAIFTGIDSAPLAKTEIHKIIKAMYRTGPISNYLCLAAKNISENKYRNSIIDSATCIEMALYEDCSLQLAPLSMEKIEYVLKRKTLGSLVEFARLLQISLPADITENLVKVRNRTIHKGYEISKDEANKALIVAKSYIESSRTPEWYTR